MLKREQGFTLVELMVTLALLGVLLGLAAPSFALWTRNAQVRTVTDSLQNGMRLAQTEALRRSRQTVFFLTNNATCNDTTRANANGRHWVVRTVALINGDPVEVVQCGVLTDVTSGVAITGPTAVCFNSMGRQVANTAPGIGTTACTLNAAGTNTYNVSGIGSDRPLRVLVTLGGQVRLCDPSRTVSSTSPDGCPS